MTTTTAADLTVMEDRQVAGHIRGQLFDPTDATGLSQLALRLIRPGVEPEAAYLGHFALAELDSGRAGVQLPTRHALVAYDIARNLWHGARNAVHPHVEKIHPSYTLRLAQSHCFYADWLRRGRDAEGAGRELRRLSDAIHAIPIAPLAQLYLGRVDLCTSYIDGAIRRFVEAADQYPDDGPYYDPHNYAYVRIHYILALVLQERTPVIELEALARRMEVEHVGYRKVRLAMESLAAMYGAAPTLFHHAGNPGHYEQARWALDLT